MRGLTRAFAVVGKEMLVVLRRPSALATLVLGPVVILAVFGLSYIGQPPVRALLVVPANSGLPTDGRAYDLNQQGVLQIVGTRPTLASARQALASHTADIVVAAPDNAVQQLRSGKQVVIQVEYDTVNPYQSAVISRLAEPLAASVNEKIVAQIVACGYRIAEIAVPTRYFPDASSASFSASTGYGLRILSLLARFSLHRRGVWHSRAFDSLRGRYTRLQPAPTAPRLAVDRRSVSALGR